MERKDRAKRILGRTLFPRADDIPQSLATAFMRMMMAHAKFESELCALQGVVANDPYYGEQRENLWSAKKRPRLMAELINTHLGQIAETGLITQLLEDAFTPTDQRNHLAHGRWWSFDRQAGTIEVRGGIQREGEEQWREYSETDISDIAERFEALETELFKLRSDIENRLGKKQDFDWSGPPE